MSPARNPQRISSTDSTFSLDSLDTVMVRQTQEKSRSDCAELAEMHRTRRARKVRGNLVDVRARRWQNYCFPAQSYIHYVVMYTISVFCKSAISDP